MGEHNLYRLRGADWNDALDMAADRVESVAFTCAYAGNLRTLAALLRRLDEEHPEYGFAKHKGYGTKAHYEAIRKYGLLPEHRRGFLKNLEAK